MSLTARIALRLFVVIVIVLLVGVALATAGFYVARHLYSADLPSVDAVQELPLQVPLRIYTQDGRKIGEFGAERRDPLRYSEVPQQMVEAFISAEDARFFEHPGVDWQGIARAAINLAQTGEKSQGGSTITMQLARNFFLTSERTYDRKIREIFLSLRMEEVLSKQQIMESYLNKIYLGERAYGVGAASKVYFGVPVEELTLSQTAVIAGLPKAPSRDNPVNNPARAVERRNYVLQRMLDLGFIDQDAFETARAEPVVVSREKVAVEVDAHYVSEMVRMFMVARFGEAAYVDGYRVTTTINSSEQHAATEAVRRGLREHTVRTGYPMPRPRLDPVLREELAAAFADDSMASPELLAGLAKLPQLPDLIRAAVLRHDGDGILALREDGTRQSVPPEGYAWAELGDKRFGSGDLIYLIENASESRWELAADPKAQAAFVALSPQTGAITALVGGYDFFGGHFNRAIQAQRQPGSALKPVIYAAAIDKGFTPASVLIDAPIVMDDYALEAEWRPRNATGRFYGPTRLREALVYSRNIISIKLLREVGIQRARAVATHFGLPLERMPNNLSLALGSPVFTPLEMARAFAVFANGGHLVAPYFIAEIRGPDDRVVDVSTPAPLCEAVPPASFSNELETDDTPVDTNGSFDTAEVAPEPEREREPAPVTPIEDPTPGINGVAPLAECQPRTVNPRVSWLVADMMRDVIRRGTARSAGSLGRDDIAGKTGTTNDETDAWFVGFQRSRAAAVWVGYDQPARLGRGEGGGRAALPIWIDYMRATLDGEPERFIDRPGGLIDMRVDRDTGELAHPQDTAAIFETLPFDNLPPTAGGGNGVGGSESALDSLY